ncbi:MULTISPECIES: DUF2147 domain-containing protein [Acinetobacter calcoaceticus/baumannii complex]|jgi:uncharacterized protein (DUF2147 family)|uniref:DUF2147 domain-containing protein n=1 Tax=Acinetobacter calcoaceticus/baumannii complex TaxID=909768 RepID=UPI0009C1512C|nr:MULTISPECIES: DUF2147 domain-containing protein [Acinetobacter calcoaceticus/baumannii complex]WHA53452.1 hypothetical protein OH685_09400 [Acinetobacter pittii]
MNIINVKPTMFKNELLLKKSSPFAILIKAQETLINKLTKFRNTFLILFFLFLNCISNTWASDIVGKWKTIDDKTGTPRAVVNINKNSDNSYSGKIEKIYNLPNGSSPKFDKCVNCKGDLNNKPMIGLNILSNFIINSKVKNEYINGQILDPASGNIYKGKITMSSNGKKIILRGYIGISLLGRSQTWIRAD